MFARTPIVQVWRSNNDTSPLKRQASNKKLAFVNEKKVLLSTRTFGRQMLFLAEISRNPEISIYKHRPRCESSPLAVYLGKGLNSITQSVTE